MIERILRTRLLELTKKYPIVTLTGPRQSGKSTLLKTSFPEYKYVSLEDPDMRLFAAEDPIFRLIPIKRIEKECTCLRALTTFF